MKTHDTELLNRTFRPLTNTIGFFETDAKTAANAFLAWKDRTYSRDGRTMQIRRVEAKSLSDLLRSLLPLTTRPCRWLFVETRSDWCAYFENWWRGTDPTAIAPLGGARLRCRSIRCTHVSYGDSPATILEVNRPLWAEGGNTERSIYAMKDGSKWSFGTFGEPFDFEQTDRYQERRIRNRFTPQMLDQYLRNYGIAAFDESFYCDSHCTAHLIKIDGPDLPNMKEYTLEDL